MFKQVKPWRVQIEDMSNIVVPYGVYQEKLLANGMNIFPLENEEIGICLATEFDHNVILRSAVLDTPSKLAHAHIVASKMFHRTKHFEGGLEVTLRLSICDLNPVAEGMDLINTQHRLIASQRDMVHVLLPFENFHKEENEGSQEASGKGAAFGKLLNMEALVVYSKWINEFVKGNQDKFLSDDASLFRLSGKMKALDTQVESPIVKNILNNINQTLIDQDKLATQPSSLTTHNDYLFLEKRLEVLRFELKDALLAHLNALKEIVKAINGVEQSYPYLRTLNHTLDIAILFFEEQLGLSEKSNFNKGFLLYLLLNRRLGISTCFICLNGLHPINFAFAISLALLQMKETFTRKPVRELIFHWEKAIEEFQKFLVNEGSTGVHLILRKLKKAETDNILLLASFQNFVFENLKQINLLVNQLNSQDNFKLEPGKIQPDHFLQFLPYFIWNLDHFGDYNKIQLIEYDYETGKPIGFTEDGIRIFSKIL